MPELLYSNRITFRYLYLAGLLLLNGCASVVGPPDERDPFESYNRAIFSFNSSADTYVMRPIAVGYRDYIPQPIQTGVSNFFSNLQDVIVLANDLMQFKFAQATSDFSRLAWNSTAGLLGFIDVASHMELPKHNEDFGQTLATWGVPNGPFFMLPLIGPSTVRDAAALPVDIYLHPTFQGIITDDTVNLWAVGLRYVDLRKNLLPATDIVDKVAIDPYSFVRDAYFQSRINLIYDGRPPEIKQLDIDFSTDLELELELEKLDKSLDIK
jgi:phospholipid-binding lipoprotein MlaA